jgi:hypothetical protein
MAATLVTPNFKLNKYDSTAGAGTVAGGDLTIAATSFTDDNGNAITAFPNHAAFSVYINGLIQPNGISTLSAASLVITGGGVLDPADPITVELVINF